MKIKTLAVTAAIAVAGLTAAAPASAGPCSAHLDTVLGGICIPIQ
jgi:hypothetical protein